MEIGEGGILGVGIQEERPALPTILEFQEARGVYNTELRLATIEHPDNGIRKNSKNFNDEL